MDFSNPPVLVALKERTQSFVRETLIPLENDPRQGPHGPSDDFRLELNALARDAGLLAPHMPEEWGGLGLDHRGKAIVFQAAGYGLLGPLALNIAAPDEGNMHLLEQVANERQKHRWLAPLAAGDSFLLRHVRAASRRGLRPVAPAHQLPKGFRRLRNQRPEMADQRR